MRAFRRLTLAAICIATVGAQTPPAAAVPAAGDIVCVYTAIDFQGTEDCYNAVGNDSDLNALKNQISSIRFVVPRTGASFSVQLYDDTGFGGEMMIASNNITDLRNLNWNDAAESLKVRQRPAACLYAGLNFTGQSTCLDMGATANIVHAVRSVKIDDPGPLVDVGGLVVHLYSAHGLTGSELRVVGTAGSLTPHGWGLNPPSVRLERFTCDYRDLKFDWPLRGDGSVNPLYANANPYFGYIGQYVGIKQGVNIVTGTAALLDELGKVGHNGIDISTPSYRTTYNDGTTVHAAANGVVVGRRDGLFYQGGGAGPDEWKSHPPLQVPGMSSWDGVPYDDGSGNVVFLQHDNGFLTQYAHLKDNITSQAALGNWVAKGTRLATAASSGASSGTHLHWGVFASKQCQALYPHVFSPTRRFNKQPDRISIAANNAPAEGMFIDPLFPANDPANTMLSITPPPRTPQTSNLARRRFYDVVVSGARIWQQNPSSIADTQAPVAVPAGTPIHVRADLWGAGGTAFMQVTQFGQPVVSTTGADLNFVAMNGLYQIIGHQPNAQTLQPEIAFTRTITTFSGIQQQLAPTSAVRRTLLADGQFSGIPVATLRLGEFTSAQLATRPKYAVYLGFNTTPAHQLFTAFNKTAKYGRLSFTVSGVTNTSPYLNNWGWAGRLYADLVDGNGNLMSPRIAQFNNAGNGQTAEAIIEPSALALLKGSVSIRLRFEYDNNRDNLQDYIDIAGARLWLYGG